MATRFSKSNSPIAIVRTALRSGKIANNTKWLALFALIGRSCWLVSLLLFAKAAGPFLFGEFSAYLAFWMIANRIFGIGLEIWINRNIASCENEKQHIRLAASAIWLRIIMVGAGFSLLLAASYFFDSIIRYYAMFFLLSIRQFCESLREVQVGVLQGQERMKLQAVSLAPWDILQLATVSIFALSFYSDEYLLLVSVFALISMAKAATLQMVIKFDVLRWKSFTAIAFDQYRSIAGESFFFGLSTLLAFCLGRVDILLLRSFLSPATVGNYSIAYIFLNVAIILLSIIRQALFPTLARLSKKVKSAFIGLTITSSLVFFFLGLIGGIFLAIAGPYLLLAIGKSFAEAQYIIKILALSLPVIAAAAAFGNSINAAGLERKGVVVQGCGLLANILANLLWIPAIGASGAAYATLVSYLTIFLGYGYILNVFRKTVVSETGIQFS